MSGILDCGVGDYSLDEKVVGTWIDGKPLYQRTVNISSLTKKGTLYRGYYTFGFAIKEFLYAEAIDFWDGGSSPFPFKSPTSVTTLWLTNNTYTDTSSTTVPKNSVAVDNNTNSGNFYVTVQYTKVSDY